MTTTNTDIATAAPTTEATHIKPRRSPKFVGKAKTGREAAGGMATAASLPPCDSRPATPAPARVNRTDQLISLLRTPDGASIEDLCERFGWLPHSARAALTELRKRGLDVQRSKAGTVTVYRIAGA